MPLCLSIPLQISGSVVAVSEFADREFFIRSSLFPDDESRLQFLLLTHDNMQIYYFKKLQKGALDSARDDEWLGHRPDLRGSYLSIQYMISGGFPR